MQPDFAHAVAKLCRRLGIQVAVETAGHVVWKTLARIATATDLFLYDVKHVDEGMHEKFVGVSSKTILANLKRLIESGKDVTVRVPVIPGCNDTPDIIGAIGKKVLELGVRRVSLLPFNPSSAGKYSWVRREYPLSGTARQADEAMKKLEDVLREKGLVIIPP